MRRFADLEMPLAELTLCAMCGRLRVGKGFFERYRSAGRSCHVFGLLMRRCSWPLAIMLSADRVPVKSTRLIGAVALVGCLALWADWLGCVIRSLPFPTSCAGDVPRVFVVLRYVYAGSGVR